MAANHAFPGSQGKPRGVRRRTGGVWWWRRRLDADALPDAEQPLCHHHCVGRCRLTVPPGSRILFVNNDGRRHDMTSDDHPDHLECPALNQVGLLAPGQSRESGNLVVVRTCGFHDHEDPNNNNLKGQIIVR